MTDVVVRIGVDELAGTRIRMDRGKTEVPNMVGPPSFIEENVPVRPSLGPRVEIVDHRSPVRLPEAPSSVRRGVEARRRSLAKPDVFVGVEPAHQRDVAVHLLPTRPVFIPVEADPPGVLRGRWIVEDRLRPLDDEVAVVVP